VEVASQLLALVADRDELGRVPRPFRPDTHSMQLLVGWVAVQFASRTPELAKFCRSERAQVGPVEARQRGDRRREVVEEPQITLPPEGGRPLVAAAPALS